ncbi:MAG: 5'/3'-nucleotidase SurE [Candidatus Aminicenantes bacterium]|nr:5'/3'-nucleotidase SurE [Candidatus Aminicenantes bacterium]
MTPKPLILLTNDDGFFAEGIQALFRELKDLGRLFIVAPDREKSASSLSLSLRQPLRVQRIRSNIYSVEGTPADCIYLAMKKFLPRTPDLLVSGMNPGPNLGQQDVSYSGTVSAAVQGTFFQVPSMAVSLIADQDGDFHFREAAQVVHRLTKFLLQHRLPEGITLSVNIPPPPLKGIKVTKVGIKRYEPDIIEKKDPRENSYYWIGRGNPKIVGDDETDVRAAQKGFITVTPLRIDLTDYEAMRLTFMKKLTRTVASK